MRHKIDAAKVEQKHWRDEFEKGYYLSSKNVKWYFGVFYDSEPFSPFEVSYITLINGQDKLNWPRNYLTSEKEDHNEKFNDKMDDILCKIKD